MLVDGDKIKSIDKILNKLQDQLDDEDLLEQKRKALKARILETNERLKLNKKTPALSAQEPKAHFATREELQTYMRTLQSKKDYYRKLGYEPTDIIKEIPKTVIKSMGSITNEGFIAKQ
ncbi:MAG: hypothetical protein QXI16_05000 [Sulfolobaceae archaeon]